MATEAPAWVDAGETVSLSVKWASTGATVGALVGVGES